ncbi:hypothetical protein J6590_000075 [Homalodisca vitripennis]|nr:hypothetical protein J6590_000075 [Homalodisca vitripennis]
MVQNAVGDKSRPFYTSTYTIFSVIYLTNNPYTEFQKDFPLKVVQNIGAIIVTDKVWDLDKWCQCSPVGIAFVNIAANISVSVPINMRRGFATLFLLVLKN